MGHGYNYKNIIDLCNYFQEKRHMQGNQIPRRHSTDTFRHICAILSPTGNVLGVGYNHSSRLGINMSKHAEHHGFENAMNNIIRKEGRDRLIKGPMCVDVLVVRDTGYNSKPCNNCINKHILGNDYFNVRNVYYSHEVEGIIKTNTTDLFNTRDEHYSRYYANTQNINMGMNMGMDIGMDMGTGTGTCDEHDGHNDGCGLCEDEDESDPEPKGLACNGTCLWRH